MNQSPETLIFTKFNILTDFGGYFTLNIPIFCQKCGKCCTKTSFPDPSNLEHYLYIHPSMPTSEKCMDARISNQGYLSIIHTKPCVFLKNNSCLIYKYRPEYCKEWFPRRSNECGALNLHTRMCVELLKGRLYQVGIRQIIYIGEGSVSATYPHVLSLDHIDKEILTGYQSGSFEELTRLWKTFLTFGTTDPKRQIFLALNPSIKSVIN
ncbi:MAG: YkgJ family cysteine cluster protein [Candidatus Heimdallarchaeota archaeon]